MSQRSSSSLYDISRLVEPLAEGATILTPNQRLARHIRAQWDVRQRDTGQLAWARPQVYAQQEWLERQWLQAVADRKLPPFQRLNSQQARQIWRRVISQQGAKDSGLALLEPSNAAELAANARNTLLSWQVDWRTSRWRHLFGLDRDCDAFAQWLTTFEQTLAESGQGTVLDCLAVLAQQSATLFDEPVYLLECDGAPPLFSSALEAICSNIQSLPPAPGRASKRLYAFDSPADELRSVADWAAACFRDEPGVSIGIVLTDMPRDRLPLEYQLRRAFDCLGSRYTDLPVNFSTGIPLAHAPVVRDALRALALGLLETTVPQIVQLMNSRYLALPDAYSPLALHFVEQLYAAGSEKLNISRLRTLASEVRLADAEGLELGRILSRISRLRELRGKALPGQWGERFHAVLSQWGWPAEASLDSLEYQQVKRWYELLESLRSLDSVSEPLDYAQALTLLRDLALEAISQPQTADGDVQILGPLEAIGLQFDHLWMVGMQASRWPEIPRPNPFLPVTMQTELGMPRSTAQREWTIGELRLAQYERAVGVLHASYARQNEGVVEFPSAQLASFEVREPVSAPALPEQWLQSQAAARWELVEDNKAPALLLDSHEPISGGSGLLEDQAQCPFRAFAHRRLAVSPLGDFSLALSAAERGSALHNALYALWGSVVDHRRLVALEDTQLRQFIAEAAHAGLARIHSQRGGDLPATYWNLERTRLENVLHEWLDLERSRVGFVVRAREEKVTLKLAQLSLTLRIDRVDQLEDGTRVIMDYKSSASSVGDWMGERPAKPQLLLYGLASGGAADGLAFAQVRIDDCKFVGLGKSEFAPGIGTSLEKYIETDGDAWEAINARWAETLECLAQSFVDGEAAVDPLSPSSCTWCGLQPLCRIDRQVPAGKST